MKSINNGALALVNGIVAHGIDGAGPLDSAVSLADHYRRDEGYGGDDARIAAMIRWEAAKSAGTGFATGVVGGPWMAVGIPAAMYSALVVQARLVAAIAHLRGYSLTDERVRTFILLCLVGDGAVDVLKEVGVTVVSKLSLVALERLPGRVLIAINKAVGFRLFTKFGTKGVINLVRWLPVAGGVFGAAVDGTATAATGKLAAMVFTRRCAWQQADAEEQAAK